MSKFVTATHQSNKLGKIHYIEEINGRLDNLAHCNMIGPWESVTTTYKDRYEGRICKKCFKAYISSLNENGGES